MADALGEGDDQRADLLVPGGVRGGQRDHAAVVQEHGGTAAARGDGCGTGRGGRRQRCGRRVAGGRLRARRGRRRRPAGRAAPGRRGIERGAQRGDQPLRGLEHEIGSLGDAERRGVGASVAGDHHGADPGAAPGDHVPVEGVADVPGLRRGDAEPLRRQADHARVRLADPDLVGVHLHAEEAVQPQVGEDRAVGPTGVGVGDDPERDPARGALGEQLVDARALVVLGDQGRHRREQLAGVEGEGAPHRVREIGEEEVADDLGRGQLARGEAAGGGVLPHREGGSPGAQRLRDRTCVETGAERRGPGDDVLGELLRPGRPGDGRDDHAAEVQEQRRGGGQLRDPARRGERDGRGGEIEGAGRSGHGGPSTGRSGGGAGPVISTLGGMGARPVNGG